MVWPDERDDGDHPSWMDYDDHPSLMNDGNDDDDHQPSLMYSGASEYGPSPI
jgi:hypothetical protein